jgi:hypothetical protein
MKNNYWSVIASALLVLPLFQAHAAENNGTNWIAERCAAYRGGYCRVPFHVALANARDLVSISGGVQLRGYLVREPDGYALYESRSSAQRGWHTDAILIVVPTSEEIASSIAARDQSLVIVKGRISLVASDHDEYWVQFVVDKPVTIAPTVGDKLKK